LTSGFNLIDIQGVSMSGHQQARPDRGSELEEQRLREEVASCTLILNSLGILGYSGHVSARLPDGKHILIQSFDQSRASLAPEDLLICDLDGNVAVGPKGIRAPAEVYLHTEVLKARADVNAVAHFHDDLATTFTIVKNRPLLPVKNHAIRWASGIPVHPDPSHVSDSQLGHALAKTLGGHQALQIRAHGQVIVAESVKALLIDSVHFVENARALYDAHLLGEIEPLTPEELEAFGRTFNRDRHVAKLWKYYLGRAVDDGVIPQSWSSVAA
jgi:ribulose-5-phosphate 4-epimerase/fuculose-1-phosphate aldolase